MAAAQSVGGDLAGCEQQQHQMASENEREQERPGGRLLSSSRYSKRVVLSAILREEARDLEGQRVVVGGWVKSCKHKEAAEGKKSPPQAPGVVSTDMTCSEVLFIRLSFLRPLAKLLFSVVAGEQPAVRRPAESGNHAAPLAISHFKINDGSCHRNLQVIVDSSTIFPNACEITVGASVLVEGTLRRPPPPAKGRTIELAAVKLLHVGLSDPHKYPLAKNKKLTMEYARQYPHLRPRTTTVASITRIRNGLSSATNAFFRENGFLQVHMPVITTTGASTAPDNRPLLQITTLLGSSKEGGGATGTGHTPETEATDDDGHLGAVREAIKAKSRRIEELKRSSSNRDALVTALEDLKKANELALRLELRRSAGSSSSAAAASPRMEKVDFSKDLFSRPAYLSMSAGLHLESYACALSSVYTFGPIFQATSPAPKNLAEAWMVEVELAFSELEDVMNCAEDYLKFMCQWILDNASDDLRYASKQIDRDCVDRLRMVTSSTFERISYANAVEILRKATDKAFATNIEWGADMSEEHERYLVDEMYKRPIIVFDYPKQLRSFYAHLKEDGRTVSSFDIIAPKVGVLIRGNQKEERIDAISSRIEEVGLPREQYEWYLELRRHGTVKHSGFSLGFENMVMFATGIDDAGDVIPFPRSSGKALA